MANYSDLITSVRAVIDANNNNEITGPILQNVLVTMINSLGSGYLFMGVATTLMNPGTPDQNVAYIGSAGTYTHFGNKTIPSDNIGVLTWNGSWSVKTLAVGGGGGGSNEQTIDGTDVSNILGIPINGACVLAICTLGDSPSYGIVAVSEVEDLGGAVMITQGYGNIELSSNVEIGEDSGGDTLLEIPLNGGSDTMSVVLISGTAPGTIDSYSSTAIVTSNDSMAWQTIGGASGAVKYDEAQTLSDAEKKQARTNINAADDDDLVLLATIDCSTITAGGGFNVVSTKPLKEIFITWTSMKGSTSTASGFQAYKINETTGVLGSGAMIPYNQNGTNGWTRITYNGFYRYERMNGAAASNNYTLAGLQTMYCVNQSVFNGGRITSVYFSSNATYPVASGTIKVYGR